MTPLYHAYFRFTHGGSMLDRVLRIQNLGKFQNVSASSDDARLNPVTLIYADNGMGKTTLTALLRSFATGEPHPIQERASVSASEPPKIKLRLHNNVVANFDGRAARWDRTKPDIYIFDDHFIEQNVCSGLSMDLDHRRNLHSIVVGSRGVELANRVRDADHRSREHTRTLNNLENRIKPYIYGNLSVEDFCVLEHDSDVDAKIAQVQSELSAAQQAGEIQSKHSFTAPTLPTIDRNTIETTLSETLDDLNEQAEQQVRDRIAELPEGGANWIEQGVGFYESQADSRCPFCRQPADGLSLVVAFRAYFSTSYRNLTERLDNLKRRLEADFGGDAQSRLLQLLHAENDKHEFWAKHVTLDDSELPLENLQDAWRKARDYAMQAMATKQGSPLERHELDEECKNAIAEYEKLREQVTSICEQRTSKNENIEKLKTSAGSADISTIQTRLNDLRNRQARWSDELSDLCDQYQDVAKKRKQAAEAKSEANEELRTHSQKVFGTHSEAINRYLDDFGAGFRISQMSESREGGRPGTNFGIVIDGHDISLGRSNTPSGTPCFRSAVSAGDRRSLALAFFLSQLEHETDLSEATIVLDDPMSSLDSHRQEMTRAHAVRLKERASQVLVLSHSPEFLRHVWDKLPNNERKALAIRRTPDGSTLKPWAIEAWTRSDYHQKRAVLKAFDSGEDVSVREVACSIRPMLEEYLQIVYPGVIDGPNEWLGTFLEKARKGIENGSPIIDQDDYRELNHLNDYTQKFHHGSESISVSTFINEQQLLTHVRKALAFVDRRVVKAEPTY
jgi:wobble nucleotide-excising tRNase